MKKIYVLAGNLREYDYFRRRLGFSLMDMRYISDVSTIYDLYGVDAPIIVKTGSGSWTNRRDYAEIVDYAFRHNAILMNEWDFKDLLEKEKEMTKAPLEVTIVAKCEGAMERWLDGMTNERWDKPAPIFHGEVSEIAATRKKTWLEIWEAAHAGPPDVGVEANCKDIAMENLKERMSRYMRDFTEESLSNNKKEVEKTSEEEWLRPWQMKELYKILEELHLPFDAGIGASISSRNPSLNSPPLSDDGNGWHIAVEKPTAIVAHPAEKINIVAAAVEKTSLKDAEDKIVKILNELDEPEKNLLYRVLYLGGIRIEGAELVARKNFKT